MAPIRTPIETAPLNEMYARVIYQLAVVHYRQVKRTNPDYHPQWTDFFEAWQDTMKQFPYLKVPMLSFVKMLATGMRADVWREVYPDYRGLRRVDKVRLRSPR